MVIGRLFFPSLMFRERELRTRMGWILLVIGVSLATLTTTVVLRAHGTQGRANDPGSAVVTPFNK